MIVECWNEHGESRAIEMDENNRAYGWVYYKHTDGQWVTLRKASSDEIYRAERSQAAQRDDDTCTDCNGTGWDKTYQRECDCVAGSGHGFGMSD